MDGFSASETDSEIDNAEGSDVEEEEDAEQEEIGNFWGGLTTWAPQ